MKKFLIPLVVLLCGIACKMNEPQRGEFNVVLKVLVKEDDQFKVYYTSNDTSAYNEREKVEVEVKGSDSFQRVSFSLPLIPKAFRIDLGELGNESMVVISEITLLEGEKEIRIDKNILHRLFKPNVYLSMSQDGYLRRKVGERYDPFIETTALMEKKLQLEFVF